MSPTRRFFFFFYLGLNNNRGDQLHSAVLMVAHLTRSELRSSQGEGETV